MTVILILQMHLHNICETTTTDEEEEEDYDNGENMEKNIRRALEESGLPKPGVSVSVICNIF